MNKILIVSEIDHLNKELFARDEDINKLKQEKDQGKFIQ